MIVKELAAEGYATRAIAPVVGANQATVVRDMQASDANASDAPRTVKSIDGVERTFQPRPEPVTVDHETGEVSAAHRTLCPCLI